MSDEGRLGRTLANGASALKPSQMLSLCVISTELTEAAPRVAMSTRVWLVKLRTPICNPFKPA